MERKVYAIGETVLDIIFDSGQVKAARPGGAMLNSSVSLGRAGINVSFITEFGFDQTGKLILDFLNKNGVSTQNIHQYKDGKTPLAMAFLNEKGDASYDFYKPYPNERLKVKIPDFQSSDILLFGSFFGIDPGIRKKLLEIVKAAHKSGCLIVYDPNFRKPHAHELDKLRPFILENMNLAHIIRASNEDAEIIFGEKSIQGLEKAISKKDKIIIMTHSSEKVELASPSTNSTYPVKKIKVVSTIGAGDNFNAGLIYGLIKENVKPSDLENLSPEKWEKIISFAIDFSANVCMSFDNYISEDFAKRIER
ncbi:MAG: carbohydrate kinase [Bacteroidetes bacterium]|nr:MAG: carbohydrate kinase [Bacteroidota bacterium]